MSKLTDMHIQNMTFGQLRQALAQCQDHRMEYQIRCAMMDLYQQHMRSKQRRASYNRPYVSIDEFVQLVEKNPECQEFENKFLPQIEKDFVNNGILDRMNSDIDINKSKKRKTVMSPFSDVGDCVYASFDAIGEAPPDDFSNKRIIP